MNTDSNNDFSAAVKLEKAQTRGPGSKLKTAREKANLSLQDVANKLYLTTTVLQAIEADDFSRTPGVTFMRGYLRAYARLVNISSEEVIIAFNNLGLKDGPVNMSTQEIYKDAKTGMGRAATWFTGFLGLVFILLIFTWWYGHSSDSSDTSLAKNGAITVINSGDTATASTAETANPNQLTVTTSVAGEHADEKLNVIHKPMSFAELNKKAHQQDNSKSTVHKQQPKAHPKEHHSTVHRPHHSKTETLARKHQPEHAQRSHKPQRDNSIF